MSNTNLIENVYLFKGLRAELLNKINEISRLERYSAGSEVFAKNDIAKGLYVVKFGSVKIFQETEKGDPILIATLGTGSHFGEMAFLDGANRSASSVAIENSEIVFIDYDKLKALLDVDKEIAVHFYRELATFLGGRLRVTTNDLSFSREKNLRHF